MHCRSKKLAKHYIYIMIMTMMMTNIETSEGLQADLSV